MCYFDKTLEKKSKHDSIIDIDSNRLLAQYEFKKQLNCSSLSESVPGHKNDLDAYKKKYKYRYGKKKGLAKLDCYYERKIFDKIEQVHDLAKKFVDDKKSYKKEIYRKYGYLFITFALIPLLGLVIRIVFSKYNPLSEKLCFSECRSKHDGSNNLDDTPQKAQETHLGKNLILTSINQDTCNIIVAVNSVITYLLIILFLFVVIYILIKVIKYEKLKSCKGKMSIKEHYKFYKNLLK
ncbi:Plasmodium exported protein, unknown function [Plasmodium vivax]|nr:Plasmodium exported protein, unknown function [Plasmodium vivax]